MISVYAVFWYISVGDSYKFCDFLQWGELSSNVTDCLKEGRSKKPIALAFSAVPFTGLLEFYTGHHFNGIFELALGIITILSIYTHLYLNCQEHIKACISVGLFILLLIFYLADIAHMICTKMFEAFYLIELILSLIAVSVGRLKVGMLCKNILLLVMISTEILTMLKGTYVVWFDKLLDKDGCALVDSTQYIM